MKRIIIYALMLAMLTSCAGLTMVTVPNSNVNYVGQDIETLRSVRYTLEKTYIFGIGGLSAKARNTNIIDELMKNANLGTNESLAYITVSTNINSITALYIKVKYTATGYVVGPQDCKATDDAPEAANRTEYSSKAKQVQKVSSKEQKRNASNLYNLANRAKSKAGLETLKEKVEQDYNAGLIGEVDRDQLIARIERGLAQYK